MVIITLKSIKDNLYLFLPIMCIGLWALAYLINVHFIFYQKHDFIDFYEGGMQILLDPANLYNEQPKFVYFPSFGISLSVLALLFPFSIAYYIFYFINIIAAISSIKEFNKILILMELKEKIIRFLFLIVISNGIIIYNIFSYSQTKFIVAAILFLIIRKELQYEKTEKVKTLNFFLINYSLFVFMIGIYPVMIIFFLIYLFHDISIINVFKKKNVEKYCIFILMFIIQNFLFIVYPNLLFDFLYAVMNYGGEGWVLFYLDLLNPLPYYAYIVLIIILFIFALFLITRKNLKIEEKFGFISLCLIIFSPFTYYRSLVIFIPATLLLFVPFLNLDNKGIPFLKENKVELIGILSVIPFYFYINTVTVFKYFRFTITYFIFFFIYLRYIPLLVIFGSCILFLYMKNKKLFLNK